MSDACTAGVVASAAELLDASQLETSVRCLMVLAMLLTGSTAARQQLAASPAALQQVRPADFVRKGSIPADAIASLVKSWCTCHLLSVQRCVPWTASIVGFTGQAKPLLLS
jgi:hypothetical protein